METAQHSKKGYGYMLLVFGIIFFLMPFFSFADSDGLQEEIDEAKSKGKKEVKIGNGTYDENITLSKGMRIVGKSKSGVVISGKVTMSDGSKLEKLTINSGSVYVKSGADVTIENVVIKNSHRNAIETYGTGKLKVKNSKIHGAGAKGMYIQTGKNVEIIGNEVYKNREEGIDIRSNVDGVISGNAVYGNGESGIEVILGKSELSISGNTVKSNGSSGIAAQYYETANSLGTVEIKSNKITKNKKYGVDCSIPSGAKAFAVSYWRKSMSLESNTFSENNKGAINGECRISNSDSTGKNVDIQVQQSKSTQSEEEMADEQKSDEEIEAEKKNEQEIRSKLENMKNDLAESKEKTEQDIRDIRSRNSIEVFFLGYDKKKIAELKSGSDRTKNYSIEIEELMGKIRNGTDMSMAMSLKKEIEQEARVQDKIISEQEGKFSILSWLGNIFKFN